MLNENGIKLLMFKKVFRAKKQQRPLPNKICAIFHSVASEERIELKGESVANAAFKRP